MEIQFENSKIRVQWQIVAWSLFRTGFEPCIHSAFIKVGFVVLYRHFHSPAKPPVEL